MLSSHPAILERMLSEKRKTPKKMIAPTESKMARLINVKKRHRQPPQSKLTRKQKIAYGLLFLIVCVSFVEAAKKDALAAKKSPKLKGEAARKEMASQLQAICTGKTINRKPLNKVPDMQLGSLKNGTWAPLSCVKDQIASKPFSSKCRRERRKHEAVYNADINLDDLSFDQTRQNVRKKWKDAAKKMAIEKEDFLNNPLLSPPQKIIADDMITTLEQLIFAQIITETISGPTPLGNCGEMEADAMMQIFKLSNYLNLDIRLSIVVSEKDASSPGYREREEDHQYLILGDMDNPNAVQTLCDPWNHLMIILSQAPTHPIYSFYSNHWASVGATPLSLSYPSESAQPLLGFFSKKLKEIGLKPMINRTSFEFSEEEVNKMSLA